MAQTVILDGGDVVMWSLYRYTALSGWLDRPHLTVNRLQYGRVDRTAGDDKVDDGYYLAGLSADRLPCSSDMYPTDHHDPGGAGPRA